MVPLIFFLCFAATQVTRQLHQERTQVVCSNKVARKRLARRHSAMDPRLDLRFVCDSKWKCLSRKIERICLQCDDPTEDTFVPHEDRATESDEEKCEEYDSADDLTENTFVGLAGDP